MNNIDRESKKQLLTAGIWSAAVLAVIAVGMMTFFSAASRRDRPPKHDRPVPAVTEQETAEETLPPVPVSPGKKTPQEKTQVPQDTSAAESEPQEKPVLPLPAEQKPNPADRKPEQELPASSYPASGTFVCSMPVGGAVTKAFTEDVAVYSLTMNDYRVHNGIDIAAPVGTNVTACAAGTVERVWEDPFLGGCVLISHGGGMQSLYANLSPERPKGMEAGATVLEGDVIGGIGETMTIEMADTDHLHFCVLKDGVYVDPLAYLSTVPEDVPSLPES